MLPAVETAINTSVRFVAYKMWQGVPSADVYLWDEYLMFAYLFGIADKVAKQLKDMYPEIVNEMDTNSNTMFDFDIFMCVNYISKKSFNVASKAKVSAVKEAARKYSSGGGGFSSSGGGTCSRGGGGGSAGGR